VASAPAGQPALPIVLKALPATFLLAGAAMVMAVSIALPLGILAALNPASWIDRLVAVLSLAGVSVVEFWLALILIWVFAVNLGWLPTSGYGTVWHIILPALALTWRTAGRITQIVRTTMLDELGKPYIKTARAKGLSPARVAVMHALKNAGMPIVTNIGDETANILTGAIIIESIFGWPGIGLVTIDALQRADLPVVQAAVLVIAILVILTNLLVDMIYALLNPRVRFGK
ncbi:MAG: ABC transporter permease, partial [Pararhodobacter sp.]|nr:ABC transporter permease [Pararhodobacter sp.]